MAFQVGTCLIVGYRSSNECFQHVDHVHFHVCPKPNEKEGLVFNEENFVQRKVTKEELSATLEGMKARMK